MIQSVMARHRDDASEVLQPIPKRGINDVIIASRAKGELVRVVPVICMTETGCITKPALKVALVNHAKGGGNMLPHLELLERYTPYESVRAGLVSELDVPPEQLKHVSSSSVLLGWHLHSIPAQRVKHVAAVGSDIKKLLVFLKVCVDPKFTMRSEAFKGWGWTTSLTFAKAAMRSMRDDAKFDAEVGAIASATRWST